MSKFITKGFENSSLTNRTISKVGNIFKKQNLFWDSYHKGTYIKSKNQ